MTFNEGSDISGGRTSRRGRNAGIALGGGGLGILAIVLIGQLLGVDLSGLVGTDSGTGTSPTDSSLEQCQTGEDANQNLDCRMKGAAASLEEFWSNTLDGATPTEIALFTGSVSTGCGGATSAVGPFYCPRDQVIYVDTAFFDQLRTQFGSSGGPLAQLYVVGHEWGHHIQNITGIMSNLNLQTTGPASDGVRLELQADCFAGAWIAGASRTLDSSGTPYLEPPTDAQIRDALSAAAAVGDDNIQEQTQGQVQPETWTHGSSDARQKWFLVGYQQGANACDTFGASASELEN
ncbi:MAG: neutral zinc metallopeptidase [Microbacteriaceae bacterium]